MSSPTPIPASEPDDVAQGLAAIERYVAGHAPSTPVPVPAAAAEMAAVSQVGETKRVRELRAAVAEAHRLVELQVDGWVIGASDPHRAVQAHQRAQQAAQQQLQQAPAALTAPAALVDVVGDTPTRTGDLVALDAGPGVDPAGNEHDRAAAGVALVVEAMAIAGLWAHLTTAPICELVEAGRTCPDPHVRAAADRVLAEGEQLRGALVDAVTDAYRQVQNDPAAPRRAQDPGGEH
ncbi:hypothetical protein [Sphaerisporangium dianthi]|uniref:Uncharacterized protein n=1 Tax=Sphaerisporangium dianthi TaxID=1436120 RepID=A0ABV9CVC0_9ACTN